MVATLPTNRVGAHFRAAPPAELPELPATARARGQLYSDAVMHAVLTLKRQLVHDDAAIAAAAANSILDLERTRIRHGRSVAGSEHVSEAMRRYEDEESHKFDWMDETPATMPGAVPRTDEAAFAEHVAEVAAYAAGSDESFGAPPAAFVRWLLNQWGTTAGAIPAGGLLAHLREHGTGDTPA